MRMAKGIRRTRQDGSGPRCRILSFWPAAVGRDAWSDRPNAPSYGAGEPEAAGAGGGGGVGVWTGGCGGIVALGAG